jgi:hypothetical protein
VATASAPSTAKPRDESLRRRPKTRSAILVLLQVAELEADDLGEIDAVVHARLMQVTGRDKREWSSSKVRRAPSDAWVAARSRRR